MSRKYIHFFIFVFSVVFVFTFVIKAGVLFYARGKVARELSRMLQVPVKIGKVSVTVPFGWLEVRGLKIINPPGYHEPAAFSINRAWINLGYLASLFSRRPVIDTILLDRPELVFEMKRNRQTNWNDITLGLKKKPKKKPTGRPADFVIKKIILWGGRVI